ncbi:hypothetical protein LFM09_10560 [Lentzea alba]|uniref:hypothetical protein n=1 Tax=Lentzea alba TaxID=2714351 RepID=UPI0039BFA8F4
MTNLGTIEVNDGLVPVAYNGTAHQLETEVSWTQLDNIGVQPLRGTPRNHRTPADPGQPDDEAFVNEGRHVHSSQVFAAPSETGINLYATGSFGTGPLPWYRPGMVGNAALDTFAGGTDWDVSDLRGQSAQVQLIDQATGARGHLLPISCS